MAITAVKSIGFLALFGTALTREVLLLVGCNYSGLVCVIAIWLDLIWSHLHLIWSEILIQLYLILSQTILE